MKPIRSRGPLYLNQHAARFADRRLKRGAGGDAAAIEDQMGDDDIDDEQCGEGQQNV